MKRFLKLILLSIVLIVGGGGLTAVGFLPLTILGVVCIVAGLGLFVYLVA